MRIPRLYLDQSLESGQWIALPLSTAHHVVRVLRLRPPAPLTLFNGTGVEFSACLADPPIRPATPANVMHKRAAPTAPVYCQVLEEKRGRSAELPYPLTLLQALPQGDKMDWIIEKMVECGVAAIQPLISQFGAAAPSPDRLAKKMRHWQEIIIAASEQSGRLRIAHIHPPVTVAHYLRELEANSQPTTNHCYFDPQAATTLNQLTIDAANGCSLMIGPEGGWSSEELQQFNAASFQGARLGPRILRCETAGIVAISALSAHQGWLG